MFEFNLDDLFNSVENPLDWDKDSYKFNRDNPDMVTITSLLENYIKSHFHFIQEERRISSRRNKAIAEEVEEVKSEKE